MIRWMAAALAVVFLTAACNTMDGIVTDVDHGVSKLKGEERNR